jgi:hypothetical protein
MSEEFDIDEVISKANAANTTGYMFNAEGSKLHPRPGSYGSYGDLNGMFDSISAMQRVLSGEILSV